MHRFSERMAGLRQIREHTGAAMAACDEALKACDGDIEAACQHSAVTVRRSYDGDPRHTCHDECPPWPFAWVGRDKRGHLCSTHCERHPDSRTHSAAEVLNLVNLDTLEQAHAHLYMIEGALSICGYDPVWVVRFLRQAGAPYV